MFKEKKNKKGDPSSSHQRFFSSPPEEYYTFRWKHFAWETFVYALTKKIKSEEKWDFKLKRETLTLYPSS